MLHASQMQKQINQLHQVQVCIKMYTFESMRKENIEQNMIGPNGEKRSRENRGKFFDFDYFHFVQPKKPKQITARAIDIKRVRILIQTDIIAESLR